MKTATTKPTPTAEENHARAMMRLIHQVTASHPERTTLELNVRQRLIIQSLGIGGSRTIAAIGLQLGLTPSTMTGLVDRLEEQGYVRREDHPSDRRATLLRLTRKGESAFQREVEFYRALLEETLSALGDDAKRLMLNALDCMGRRSSAGLCPPMTKRVLWTGA
ncbi:MAG: winged helix-turn-helix transcriptional regulator [Deltaproteobacteria bacterium]|nr:winged helix-turn-helix transcriptional regulator [Deltaproteobacteria bacterium]